MSFDILQKDVLHIRSCHFSSLGGSEASRAQSITGWPQPNNLKVHGLPNAGCELINDGANSEASLPCMIRME